jgi:hypothetical protein
VRSESERRNTKKCCSSLAITIRQLKSEGNEKKWEFITSGCNYIWSSLLSGQKREDKNVDRNVSCASKSLSVFRADFWVNSESCLTDSKSSSTNSTIFFNLNSWLTSGDSYQQFSISLQLRNLLFHVCDEMVSHHFDFFYYFSLSISFTISHSSFRHLFGAMCD